MKYRRVLWKLLKYLVLLLVIGAVTWTFSRALKQLPEEGIRWSWQECLLIAGFYQLGLLSSLFLWMVLLYSLGQRYSVSNAIWAYYLGHLAKYVPGKALVVLVRASTVSGPACRIEVAAMAVFFETLAMMASGGLFVLLTILLQGTISPELGIGKAVLVFLGFIPFLLPPVFNFVAKFLTRKFRKVEDLPPAKLKFPMLLIGLGLQMLAWLGMGLSLLACISMLLPNPEQVNLFSRTAELAVAVVMGFVIPTPAGLGSREEVLRQLLQQSYAPWLAALVPLILRIVWLISEVLMVAKLFLLRQVWRKKIFIGHREVPVAPALPQVISTSDSR